jgi:hypothetical protein
MEDPLAGAQVLKQLLNKDGVLKIGLYSERARHEVVGCREVIKNTYAETNTKVIQNFRHELLKNSEDFSQIMQSADFFSMSGCRDLLFHVKEHRYTPKTLSVFINNLGMEFLGFVQVPAQYQTSFMESFPLDKRRLDLNNWELFEENNPLIFSGMYQFYLTNA